MGSHCSHRKSVAGAVVLKYGDAVGRVMWRTEWPTGRLAFSSDSAICLFAPARADGLYHYPSRARVWLVQRQLFGSSWR